MEKFSVHEGTAAPLRHSNVDTDQIIPAEYLKRISRSGFEDGLFAAWRRDPDFVLNQPHHADVSVLVAGPDFGTGSSREHAVWALQNYGFKVVISARFADIFRSNAGKNGLLPALVDQSTVDLEAQEIRAGDHVASFDVDPAVKWRLLNGLDDVAISLSHKDEIDAFEARRPEFMPVTTG